MAELSLTEVAKRAGVSKSRASEVLNGRRTDEASLNKLRKIIERAKIRAEVRA